MRRVLPEAVERLNTDRAALADLSKTVGAEARTRFTDEVAADAYAALIRDVMAEPAPACAPRDWGDFEPDPNFPGYWRNRIPQEMKAFARRFR